jgi:hypothetical protein
MTSASGEGLLEDARWERATVAEQVHLTVVNLGDRFGHCHGFRTGDGTGERLSSDLALGADPHVPGGDGRRGKRSTGPGLAWRPSGRNAEADEGARLGLDGGRGPGGRPCGLTTIPEAAT